MLARAPIVRACEGNACRHALSVGRCVYLRLGIKSGRAMLDSAYNHSCTHTHTHTHTHVCTYPQTHTHAHMHACMYSQTHKHMCAHANTQLRNTHPPTSRQITQCLPLPPSQCAAQRALSSAEHRTTQIRAPPLRPLPQPPPPAPAACVADPPPAGRACRPRPARPPLPLPPPLLLPFFAPL